MPAPIGGHSARRHRRRVVLAVVLLVLAAASAQGVALVHGDRSATRVVQVAGTPLPTTTAVVIPPVPSAAPEEAQFPTPAPVVAPPPGRQVTVPILLYHYVRNNPVASDRLGFRLSVTPNDFAAQMAYLNAVGAHPVTLAMVMAALGDGPALPPNPIVLTFDDGYEDFASMATPIMQREGFVGTDYVVSGFIGRSNYMTADELEGVLDAGMVIGAHTVHHVALARISADLANTEIIVCKSVLEKLTGRPVLDFAYPYGSYSDAVGAMVQAAGFREATTSFSGYTQYSSTRFVLHRVAVNGGDSLATFAHTALLPPPLPSFKPPTADQLLAMPLPSPPPVLTIPSPYEHGHF